MSYTDKLTALSNSIKAKSPGYTGSLSLAKMKEAVDAISAGVDTSVITATAADALNTKKILLPDGTLVNGSMPNNGAISKTLITSDKSYTIPKGYHNGSGIVNIDSQIKTVTPESSEQIITSDGVKVLTGITIGGHGIKVYAGSYTFNNPVAQQINDINLGISFGGSSGLALDTYSIMLIRVSTDKIQHGEVSLLYASKINQYGNYNGSGYMYNSNISSIAEYGSKTYDRDGGELISFSIYTSKSTATSTLKYIFYRSETGTPKLLGTYDWYIWKYSSTRG